MLRASAGLLRVRAAAAHTIQLHAEHLGDGCNNGFEDIPNIIGLGFLGQLSSYVMPGTLGGDVIKA
ncbi:MAG: hypothetical protein K2Q01_05625, partial [Rickettsiales bacterium]|nr:hypothetical protein [Rickettsiales bacterium]